MALAMPRPIALASGVFHLNIRVPADLAAKVKGTAIRLPLAGRVVTVKSSDKVIMSLRTKEGMLAKVRFAEAKGALSRYWQALRAGPVTLTHRQAVALAGVAYRRRAERLENDPAITLDSLEAARSQMDTDIADWFYGEEGDEPITIDQARLLAYMQRPSGPQLLAWETGTDVDTPFAKINLAESLEHLFGADADEICAEKQVLIDEKSRKLLLKETARPSTTQRKS